MVWPDKPQNSGPRKGDVSWGHRPPLGQHLPTSCFFLPVTGFRDEQARSALPSCLTHKTEAHLGLLLRRPFPANRDEEQRPKGQAAIHQSLQCYRNEKPTCSSGEEVQFTPPEGEWISSTDLETQGRAKGMSQCQALGLSQMPAWMTEVCQGVSTRRGAPGPQTGKSLEGLGPPVQSACHPI